MKKSKQKSKVIRIKENYDNMYYFGIILIGVGVVFMSTVNIGLGIGLTALGIILMFSGVGKRNKKVVSKK
ncbi:hypothetical protein GOV12_06885 [Candidatus Pacearchaeota archaeon]|nr:hypothetical protein [Candidatus Pacearchaeota archaeon]